MTDIPQTSEESALARQNDGGAVFAARVGVGCLGMILVLVLVWSGVILVGQLDTSDGATDDHLEERLRGALGCFDMEPDHAIEWYVVENSLDEEGFRDRVLRVGGWDQIVLIAPQESGETVAKDPALSSWWLRRRIAGSRGDHGYRLLVVRDQAVVGDVTFLAETGRLRTALVSRAP